MLTTWLFVMVLFGSGHSADMPTVYEFQTEQACRAALETARRNLAKSNRGGWVECVATGRAPGRTG